MKAKILLPMMIGLAMLGAGGAAALSNAPSATAVVDDAGTLARGYRAVGAQRLSLGHYQVSFHIDVSQCSYTGSVGLPGNTGSASPGIVSLAPRAGKPKVVSVETFDSSGAPADRGFHLIVAC